MKKYFPYLLGSTLFLVSAARFWALNDLIGTVISGTAGLAAVLLPILRRK